MWAFEVERHRVWLHGSLTNLNHIKIVNLTSEDKRGWSLKAKSVGDVGVQGASRYQVQALACGRWYRQTGKCRTIFNLRVPNSCGILGHFYLDLCNCLAFCQFRRLKQWLCALFCSLQVGLLTRGNVVRAALEMKRAAVKTSSDGN
jgi:hypothetical protein